MFELRPLLSYNCVSCVLEETLYLILFLIFIHVQSSRMLSIDQYIEHNASVLYASIVLPAPHPPLFLSSFLTFLCLIYSYFTFMYYVLTLYNKVSTNEFFFKNGTRNERGNFLHCTTYCVTLRTRNTMIESYKMK